MEKDFEQLVYKIETGQFLSAPMCSQDFYRIINSGRGDIDGLINKVNDCPCNYTAAMKDVEGKDISGLDKDVLDKGSGEMSAILKLAGGGKGLLSDVSLQELQAVGRLYGDSIVGRLDGYLEYAEANIKKQKESFETPQVKAMKMLEHIVEGDNAFYNRFVSGVDKGNVEIPTWKEGLPPFWKPKERKKVKETREHIVNSAKEAGKLLQEMDPEVRDAMREIVSVASNSDGKVDKDKLNDELQKWRDGYNKATKEVNDTEKELKKLSFIYKKANDQHFATFGNDFSYEEVKNRPCLEECRRASARAAAKEWERRQSEPEYSAEKTNINELRGINEPIKHKAVAKTELSKEFISKSKEGLGH